MKLKSLKISNFRWFDGDYIFDLLDREGKPSDIILIYAPNGSGKTSVTEAVEWMFTGEVDRIGSLLKEYNKKPREGYILKNRNNTSVQPGKVEVTLIGDSGEKRLGRSTLLLKNGRVNDYGAGTLDPEFTDPESVNGERIYDYILSQSKVNEFLFAASSGDLFNNYMSLAGRKKDLEFYYRLVEVRDSLCSSLSELNKSDISLKEEHSELLMKRNVLLQGSIDKVRPQFDGFVKEFSELVKVEFFRLPDSDIPEAISGGTTTLTVLREEILDLQSSLDDMKANSKLRRFLRRRNLYFHAWTANRNEYDEVLQHLRFHEEKSTSIKAFSDLIKTEAIENLLLKYHKFSVSERDLDWSLSRVRSIINNRTEIYDHCRKLIDIVSEDLSKLRVWKVQLDDINIELGFSKVETAALDTLIDETRNSIRKSNVLLALARQRDITKIQSDLWRDFGLEDVMSSMAILSAEIGTKNQMIKELENNILDSANLAERVEQLKVNALKIAKKHSSDSCPACNHQFESHAALIEAVLQTSTFSNDALNQRKDSLTKERADLAKRKEILEEEIIAQLDKVAVVTESKLAKQNDQILKLQSSSLIIKNIEASLAKNYFLTRNSDNVQLFLEAAISNKENNQFELERNSQRCITQISRVRKIETLFSRHIAQLKIDRSEMLEQAESLEYFNLKDRLQERWIVTPENLESEEIETDLSILNSRTRIAELEREFLRIKLDYDDVAVLGPEIDDKAQSQLAKIEKDYLSCRRLLKSLQHKLSAFTVFNIATILLRLDQILLNCASIAGLLEKNKENDRIFSRISVIEPELNASREKADLITASVTQLDLALTYSNEYFQSLVKNATSLALLNDIYRLIDPNLSYHQIEFDLDMTRGKEGLFIKSGPASERIESGDKVDGSELVSPALFFSEAQSNVLSISLFLTKIAAAREQSFDFLLMDDPIQSMDDINAYAFIDMCRIFTGKFNKQIIITTHDIGFFNLFRKRFPDTLFNFKYFSIESRNRNYL